MNPSFLAPSVGNSVPDLGATARTISSSNVYLTPSSLGFQNIAMTVLGQSVFLPPSYSNVPGPNTYSIKNSGTYAFGVRDSTGVLITGISPSGSAIFLLDNVGNWSFTGSGLQPGLVTVDSVAPSDLTNIICVPYVTFDSNTSVHFLSNATGGFRTVIADNIAKTLTFPAQTVSFTQQPVAAFKISPTTLIVFNGVAGTATHLASVVTLTGSSPNYSITVAAAATLTVGTSMPAWGGETSLSQPHIAQLSPTLYVAAFVTGTNTSVVAISVSGTTTTIGTIANISTTNAVSDTVTCYPLTSTTALVIYNASAGTPNINAVVISVSGTTCTVNLPTSIPGTNNASIAASSCQLSATKFLCLVNASTTSSIINAITVSGTAVSVGASFTLETGITGFNNSTPTGTEGPGYSQSGSTRYNPRLFPLSATTALIWYMDSGQISRCAILTENAGAVTVGAIVYRSISANTISISESGLFLPPGTSEFLSIKQDGNPTGTTYKHRLISHKITGTNITVGQTTPLDTLNSQVNVQSHVAARMDSGDYVLGLSGSNVGPAQTLSVFRSNGDVVYLRGTIDVPGLIAYTFAVAKPSSNRLVLIGSSTFSGTPTVVGDTAPRVLMVELAQ